VSDERDHPYSDDELQRALAYVAEQTPNAGCPMCGNKTWAFDNEKAKKITVPRVTYTPFTNRAFFGAAPAIPTISLTCENCGFIRGHSIPMVLSKINKEFD
jgi:predicted RNA-binding Zn-ribbon protein involved in translation (DUF1610 family)